MIIGLTGGIGSGKSTVARLIRVMGYPVYNSDERARLLQDRDPKMREAIISLLGEKSYRDGRLDRSYVGSRVFKDGHLLKRLNAIVHPAVGEDFKRWARAQQSALVFKESALLVETGLFRSCDALVVVTAPPALRKQRVMRRDSVDDAAVQDRMDRQADEDERSAVADFLIVNDDRQLLIPQVEKMITSLAHSPHV